MAVKIPYENVKQLLDDAWDEDNTSRPLFVVPNAGVESVRLDLNYNDVISVTSGVPSEVENPIGTWIYVNRIWKISVDLKTKTSRERLWELKDEVRRICHRHIHTIPGFQRIQYVQFTESVEQQFNVWEGKVDIELVSNAELREI